MSDRLKICCQILQTTGGVDCYCEKAGPEPEKVLELFLTSCSSHSCISSRKPLSYHKRGKLRQNNEQGPDSNIELRCRLTLSEQEIRQLKKKNCAETATVSYGNGK